MHSGGGLRSVEAMIRRSVQWGLGGGRFGDGGATMAFSSGASRILRLGIGRLRYSLGDRDSGFRCLEIRATGCATNRPVGVEVSAGVASGGEAESSTHELIGDGQGFSCGLVRLVRLWLTVRFGAGG